MQGVWHSQTKEKKSTRFVKSTAEKRGSDAARKHSIILFNFPMRKKDSFTDDAQDPTVRIVSAPYVESRVHSGNGSRDI